MKAAPDVSRMKAAPDVSRMKAAPLLLVLLLLCVCEVGVGGAQDSPPSLSDVMKEVKLLRGMVADQRGDRAVIAAKLTAIPNKLDALQSYMYSRLSVCEAKMGEVIEAKMGEVIEAKMGEVIEKLQEHKETDGFTYDDVDGVCYYLSTEEKTWGESRRFCKTRQADLIIVNSQEKQDLVDLVVPRNIYVWIGLTDRDTEGSFKWVDGTTLTSPTFWRHGQPDSSPGDQDCGYYNTGSERGYGDLSCSDSYRWMCERVVQ